MGLGQPTVAVSHRSQLAGQSELAEAGQRPPVRPRQRDALGGGGHRQRNGQIGSRLVDPHAADDVDEHVGGAQPDPAVAAEHGQYQRDAVAIQPATTRRGGTSSEVVTSAWTSTSSGREPSIAHSTTLPGRAGRLGDEPRRGVEHLDQAVVAHLEHAGLVGRPEAVLDRAHRPVGPLPLALELQHAVDQVLEHRGPASAPSLVTWPTSSTAICSCLATA